MQIEIRHLIKKFGAFTALDDVSLTIPDGSLFFLLGPSGCGKTTLLRCIGGFEKPDGGSLLLGGEDVSDRAPSNRNTAMVFQGYALWPHMTVAENISFGLEMRHLSKQEIAEKVGRVMEQVQISSLAGRKPNELSGGQQQRVALARTLVVNPGCLLLDEPLANLDAKLRRDMRREIRRLCKENNLTAVYVTHDRQEALSMADQVAVLKNGRIIQIGSANGIYRRPVNAFVANFIGETNFVPAKVLDAGHVETAAGVWSVTVPAAFSIGEKVLLSIRPEAISLVEKTKDGPNQLQAIMRETSYLGEVAKHQAVIGKDALSLDFLELNPSGTAREGDALNLSICPEDIVVLPDEQ